MAAPTRRARWSSTGYRRTPKIDEAAFRSLWQLATAQRDEILKYLQVHKGNAFVAHGLASVTPEHGSASTDDAEPIRTPEQIQRQLEDYLRDNEKHVWNAVYEHAKTAGYADPHPRLRVNRPVFLTTWFMELAANLGDCKPLSKLDAVLYPTTAVRRLAALLPPKGSSAAWSPVLGLALAQELQIATAASLRRLGARYVEVADGHADPFAHVQPSELVHSSPLDRYVGPALCAPSAVEVVPNDNAKRGAKPRAPHLRPVKLTWQGDKDPTLWNWVRAEPVDRADPIGATAEEVAASLDWHASDTHGDKTTSYNAAFLASAPPLFGVPEKIASQHPEAGAHRPLHVGTHSVDDRLTVAAGSKAADEIALHQGADPTAHHDKAKPAIAPKPDNPVLQDVSAQLVFAMTDLGSWNLADRVAPAYGFCIGKIAQWQQLPPKQVPDWEHVVEGQRSRLSEIVAGIHALHATAKKLGIDDPNAANAAEVRDILALLATAAGTSHFAETSMAKFREAMQLQALLSTRSMQVAHREVVAAHGAHEATMAGAPSMAARSTEVEDLATRATDLENRMIGGSTVDVDQVDEVTLRSAEIAIHSRAQDARRSAQELQDSALGARDGLAARWAELFSGEFRDIPDITAKIQSSTFPILVGMERNNARIAAEIAATGGEAKQTKAQKAKHRAERRAVLATAQGAFAELQRNESLQHFFKRAAKLVENQRFRTACIQAAELIGIAIIATFTAGAAAEVLGGVAMQAEGAATVAELSTTARVGIQAVSVVVDAGVNAAGQSFVQGTSFTEAYVQNLLMSGASVGLMKSLSKLSMVEGAAGKALAKTTIGSVAWKAGAGAGSLVGHTVMGAVMGYVSARVVTGVTPSEMQLRDWVLQGASVGVGRYVGHALHEQMPSLERLAKRTHSRALEARAQAMFQLASALERSANAHSALELLDKQTALLEDEIAEIDRLAAKDGDHDGQHAQARAEVAGQVDDLRSDSAVETRFHLAGLEELVPGALWKGSRAQIEAAIDAARKSGVRVEATDKNGSWHVTINSRELTINEVVKATPQLSPYMANKGRVLLGTSRAQALADLLREAARESVTIQSDDEAQRFLNWAASQEGVAPENMHAVTMGDLVMIRREQEANVRVLREELIHSFQQRYLGYGSADLVRAEIEARLMMIKYRQKWGILPDEVLEMIRDIRTMRRTGKY